MEFQDDRPAEQKRCPYMVILMTDSFMSGWGKAEGGPSYAGWAFPEGELSRMESRIRGRSDAKRVRIVGPDYRPRHPGPGHCHIYAWKEEA